MFYLYYPHLLLAGKEIGFSQATDLAHSTFFNFSLQLLKKIFTQLLKKKSSKAHLMYYKVMHNSTYFNFIFTTSNVFVNFVKNNKILLHRSLGMLGFRKKKKKINNNAIYTLGKDFVEKLKKLYYNNHYRRVILRIKGFRRFLKSSISNLLYHLKFVSRFFSKKMKSQRKWFASKFRIAKKCFRRKIVFIQSPRQRRSESLVRREATKAKRLILRLTLINYLTSISFANHKYGTKKLYTGYFKRRFY